MQRVTRWPHRPVTACGALLVGCRGVFSADESGELVGRNCIRAATPIA